MDASLELGGVGRDGGKLGPHCVWPPGYYYFFSGTFPAFFFHSLSLPFASVAAAAAAVGPLD